MDAFELTLNGSVKHVTGVSPTVTLLEYLRHTGRVGTKEGCAEGDCGACTVTVVGKNVDGKAQYQAIDSCIAPLAAFAGREVVTVEGLAPNPKTLHLVQEAMVRTGGSQCGYCTPGFVMSLFAAYYDGRADSHIKDGAVEGNLCRCTGYLPIRRAARSLPQPQPDDPFLKTLGEARASETSRSYEFNGQYFFRPVTLGEVFDLLAKHPEAVLIAGATDVGVDINKFHRQPRVMVSLEHVAELKMIGNAPYYVDVGAAVPLTHVEEGLRGLFPALDEMLRWFAARQIRNRATLGGNLATASPIGDLPPVLMALDAELRLESAAGTRWVEVLSFFKDYRKTELRPGEVIRSVRIPKGLSAGAARRLSQVYKVGKRGTDDISIVAAAFVVDLDDAERVVSARLAYGGVAATPVRALEVEKTLLGKPWNVDTVHKAKKELERAFTPISDLRGSAAYRQKLTGNLFEKFFFETAQEVSA